MERLLRAMRDDSSFGLRPIFLTVLVLYVALCVLFLRWLYR